MVKVPSDHKLKAEITSEIKKECSRGMYSEAQYTTDRNLASEVLLPLGVVAPTEIIDCTNVLLPRVFPVPNRDDMPGKLDL